MFECANQCLLKCAKQRFHFNSILQPFSNKDSINILYYFPPCQTKVGRKVDFSSNPMFETTFEFYDKNLLDDVRRGNLQVQEFFRLLAVCHTVMPETKNGNNFFFQFIIKQGRINSRFTSKSVWVYHFSTKHAKQAFLWWLLDHCYNIFLIQLYTKSEL